MAALLDVKLAASFKCKRLQELTTILWVLFCTAAASELV